VDREAAAGDAAAEDGVVAVVALDGIAPAALFTQAGEDGCSGLR
jgi:hypothetical protein